MRADSKRSCKSTAFNDAVNEEESVMEKVIDEEHEWEEW
jgi:hypothetical protein